MTFKLEIKKNTTKLLTPAEAWDFQNPPFSLEDFSVELAELLWKEMALGLSANQVGYQYKIFATVGDPTYVFVNPRIVHFSDETVDLEETSFSYPGFVIDKVRPKHIRIRFATPSSEVFTMPFTGMTARVIQQQMDHINGIAFWDGISKLRFDMAVKKAQKLGFNYSNLHYKTTPSGLII